MTEAINAVVVYLVGIAVGVSCTIYTNDYRQAKKKKDSEQIDHALGLETLPPIRLPKNVAAELKAIASEQNLVVQAFVRSFIVGYITGLRKTPRDN
jgi:hypothetical protein